MFSGGGAGCVGMRLRLEVMEQEAHMGSLRVLPRCPEPSCLYVWVMIIAFTAQLCAMSKAL